MKSKVIRFGSLNGPAIGIIMKELVRRGIATVRNQQQVFEVTEKEGYSGRLDDLFTTADTAAQQVYLRSLRECFPTYGIIAEEDSLSIPSKHTQGLYFTLDPLDGTKAFVRRQSHGVGTMISLSSPGEFIAAFVGDINTQEVYGFRPGSNTVHRISEFNTASPLPHASSGFQEFLKKYYVLLRDPERKYSPLSCKTIKGFKDHSIDGGSIGIWMARLWKGEVGALLIPPAMETPWDSNPVNAISEKLGYTFLRPSADGTHWEEFHPQPITKLERRTHDILIIRPHNCKELNMG